MPKIKVPAPFLVIERFPSSTSEALILRTDPLPISRLPLLYRETIDAGAPTVVFDGENVTLDPLAR